MSAPQSPFLQDWAEQNPDAFSVHEGRRPQSYREAIYSHVQLLLEYAKSNDVRAKEIKPVVFRVGAHLNDVANSGEMIGKSVDISAEEAHKTLQEAAIKAAATVTEGQHAAAVAMGAARKLKLPKLPKKPPLQDAFVPYLHKSFDKRINKLLQNEAHSTVDKDELKTVALLVHGAYIDEQLKKEEIGSFISGFTEAPVKNFLRTMVKVDADYADEKNPHARLLDVVRRSANTGTLDEQEEFIAKLEKVKDGKIRKFKMIRSKETMTDDDADVKFIIANVAFTATKNGRAITFRDMVYDPCFNALADRVAKSEEIDSKTMECVVRVLGDPVLKKKACTMVVEFQLYLHRFLAVKKRLHGIYKFQRAQNLTDLVRDLVKHASNHSMAYVADANEYNDVFIARARRELRKLGLGDGELSFRHKKLPDEIGMDSLMQQVAAAGVRVLTLNDNKLGDEAGKAIGKALETNKTLETLGLRDSKLGDEAGKAIGKALETNKTLQKLDLYSNNISSGVEALMRKRSARSGIKLTI